MLKKVINFIVESYEKMMLCFLYLIGFISSILIVIMLWNALMLYSNNAELMVLKNN